MKSWAFYCFIARASMYFLLKLFVKCWKDSFFLMIFIKFSNKRNIYIYKLKEIFIIIIYISVFKIVAQKELILKIIININKQLKFVKK